MKRLLGLLLVTVFFAVAKAGTPPCINPISTIDWSFFVDALEFEGVCTCSTPGQIKIGLKWRVAEPIAFVETPRKAWEFPCFGIKKSVTKVSKKDGYTNGVQGAKTNVHYIKYPVFAVLNLVMDNLCVLKKGEKDDSGQIVNGLDILPTGFSEVNPLIWDDYLSVLVQPEKLLLANPVAQVACLADCVASSSASDDDLDSAESMRNSLFWCAGCWGAIYPDTTSIYGQDDIVESALEVVRILDVLHSSFQLMSFKEVSGLDWSANFSESSVPSDVACNPKVFPRIIKSQYWLNLAYPVSWDAIPIGDFPPKWSWFKKSPGNEDFVWTVWRIRDCCLGFQFP
jgi:conjugal transfer pilus assembly protein TraU